MLLANYTQENRNCTRVLGQAFTNPLGQSRPFLFRAFYIADEPSLAIAAEAQKSAWPNGYNTHYAWLHAEKAGGIASQYRINGQASATAAGAMGVNGEAAIAGSASLSAIGDLIVSAVAAITGTGSVSANALATLQAAATLAGSGNVSAAIEALAWAAGQCAGVGAVASEARATGALSATIEVGGSGGALTADQVATAVWSASAASNNDAGTMGEKLNDAGSAANPWAEVIESGYTAAEVLRMIAAVVQGDASGLEGAAPVFKSIDGTKDRVTATYSGGTRTVTARDAS